jgi:hypothetical protein
MGEIVLNSGEILYLTNILNMEKIVGLESLTDLKYDMGEELFNESKNSLNNKNYININDKNQVSIDIGVYILLNTCSIPETFVSFEKKDKELGIIKCNYYGYNSVCIRLIEKRIKDEYIFRFIINKEKMKEELNSFIEDINMSFDNVMTESEDNDFEKNILNFVNNNTVSYDKLRNILPGFFKKYGNSMLVFHSQKDLKNNNENICCLALDNKLLEVKEFEGTYKLVNVPKKKYSKYIDKITKYLIT